VGVLESFVQRRVATPPLCEILDTLTSVEFSSPTWTSTFISAVASAASDWTTPVTDAVNAGLPVPGALSSRLDSADGAVSAALQPTLLKVAEVAGDETSRLFLHSFALSCDKGAGAGFMWTRVTTSPYQLAISDTNLFHYAIQPFFWIRRRRIAPPLPGDSAVAASAVARDRCLAANPAFTALSAKLAAANAELAKLNEQHRAKLDAVKSHLASRSPSSAQPAPAWQSAWVSGQRKFLRNMQMVNKKPLDENGKEKMFGAHLTPFTMTDDCQALTWKVKKSDAAPAGRARGAPCPLSPLSQMPPLPRCACSLPPSLQQRGGHIPRREHQRRAAIYLRHQDEMRDPDLPCGHSRAQRHDGAPQAVQARHRL
jgi:hypothetical protein